MTAKIIIASTLKPVWDPRAYEKFAKSLVSNGDYVVDIIGSGPDIDQDEANIKFHVHQAHALSILQRVLLPFKIFSKVIKLRPDVLIITTHELLLMAVVYKFLYAKPIIYDIRENYNFNLRYQYNYPWLVKHTLAIYIRLKEVLLSYWIDKFFVAEKCYIEEIGFLKNKSKKIIVLENKFQPIDGYKKALSGDKIELLLSGTISELYGVYDAIEYFKQLPRNEYSLKIIGHCPNTHVEHEINAVCSTLDNCSVVLGNNPIPHQEILSQVSENTIGLLPYQKNKSTENKVPTKLYEYLALGVPILISDNPTWKSLVEKYKGGVAINFKSEPSIDDISICVDLIKSNYSFDYKNLMWYSEEYKFQTAINAILKN